jgi:hypothetical protein
LSRLLLDQFERSFGLGGYAGVSRSLQQLLDSLGDQELRDYAASQGLVSEADLEPEDDHEPELVAEEDA